MYKAKDETYEIVVGKNTVTKVASIIGLTREHLSNILNQNIDCSKLVAYCITKYAGADLEIEDLFDRVED